MQLAARGQDVVFGSHLSSGISFGAGLLGSRASRRNPSTVVLPLKSKPTKWVKAASNTRYASFPFCGLPRVVLRRITVREAAISQPAVKNLGFCANPPL